MSQLVMPKLGLTMTEGQLTEWRVQPGDAFQSGDVLFVVETEKVANEVEAEAAGVLSRLLIQEGETVPVGTPVAELDGGAMTQSKGDRSLAVEIPKSSAQSNAPSSNIDRVDCHTEPNLSSARILATPLARRLAQKAEINLAQVVGTGPRGRIKADDVRGASQGATTAVTLRTDSKPPITKDILGAREIIPDPARIATARRVAKAKQEIPHFYLTREAEISALMSLRQSLNDDAVQVRISVTHMLIRAFGLTLSEIPEANRIWLDEKIIVFDSADIGMVTETPDGLRIPMVRDVGRKALDQVAVEAVALAERSRSGALTGGDVGGGAVSISNVGMFGASALAPIINPPHSMILGVGAERQLFRPDQAGNPKLCREIVFTLACDHRIHDGASAAQFLNHFVSLIEAPLRLLRDARPAYELSEAPVLRQERN